MSDIILNKLAILVSYDNCNAFSVCYTDITEIHGWFSSWSLLTCFVFLVVFSSFVLLIFLLQMIAIIFDDAIYLCIYFLHFISMLLRPSPILKTIKKWAREMNKTTTLQQQTNNYHTANEI